MSLFFLPWHSPTMETSIQQPDDITPGAWDMLQRSYADYISNTALAYDEVLHSVADRIRAEGSIGKSDIGALLFWKRLRADAVWVRELMTWTDSDVREVTKLAVAAVNDTSMSVPEAASAGRRTLSPLPGFTTGDALASALLLAAAPHRMAVYDQRAQTGLEHLGLKLSRAAGRYGRYMGLVEILRTTAKQHGQSWSARDVDVALYWLGGK